jgi:hypothetical protein
MTRTPPGRGHATRRPRRLPGTVALRHLQGHLGVMAWSVADHLAPGWTAARDRRRHAALFTGTDLPLFGLPAAWRGDRSLGGGTAVTSRGQTTSSMPGLHHRSPDGGTLSVETHRHLGDPGPLRSWLADKLWRAAASPLLGDDPGAFDAVIAQRWAALARDELTWGRAEVRVDGTPLRLARLTDGEWWVASGKVDGVGLVLRGHRFPIDRVQLTRLRALDAYLTGA